MKNIRKHARELKVYRTAVVLAFAILAVSCLESSARVGCAKPCAANRAVCPDIDRGWGVPRLLQPPQP